nr:asparagine synthetase B [Actinomycetota bacterium]
MCGLWGLVDFRGIDLRRDALETVSGQLAHRGPDGSGIYSDELVALVHRRLAILDVTDASNQPTITADDRYVVLFTGEIYNFLELAATMGLSEHDRRSDTAVLARCLERWGLDTLHRLEGMFALAVWDAREQRLLLARDRLGKKPLVYYADSNGGLAFASELQALLA